METTSRLVLDENIHMCSGVCCPMRDNCHRFLLCNFYDVIARKAHSNPRFIEPAYNKETESCHWHVKPIMFKK